MSSYGIPGADAPGMAVPVARWVMSSYLRGSDF